MTRRDTAEKIFQYIRDNKYEPINIQYGNGYFMFDMGEDSVVHFNIKGLHGWEFAMWVETNPDKLKIENSKERPAIQFFCQHRLNIDKFKPSRSFFLEEFSLDDIKSYDTWVSLCIRNMFQMIKRHPFISFTMDGREDKFYNKSYIGYYLDRKIYKIKSNIKEWCNNIWIKVWHGSKLWLINRYKVVGTAKLIDQNSDDGWEVSPRYEIRIHFRQISDNEDEQCDAETKMLNRWFHKNDYNNMGLSLTRDGIESPYRYQMSK